MSDEDDLGQELGRAVRVLVTGGSQAAERLARIRADRDRMRQQEGTATQRAQDQAESARRAAQREEHVALERRLRDNIAAARTVYSPVRDERFWKGADDTLQRRVGEALVVSASMREHDPVARTAHDYLRREATERYGDRADDWMIAAVARYREELAEQADRDQAHAEADDATEVGRDDIAEERESEADEHDRHADHEHTQGDAALNEHTVAADQEQVTDQQATHAKKTSDKGHPIEARTDLNRGGRHKGRAKARSRGRQAKEEARGR